MKKLTLILSMLIALVGFNANAAMYIVGNVPFGDWNPNGGVEMTLENGVYTYTATINGTVYFVFGDGQADWPTFNTDHRYGPANGNEGVTAGVWHTTQKAGDNGAYFFEGTGGEYVFTFDEANHQFKVEGYVAPIVISTYTVVGPEEVFGSYWDETDENNDMTLVNGVYTWTKENVQLTAGNLEYKIVGNHDWGHEWPQGMVNFTEPVPANGIYNITITFDPETEEPSCTLVPVQEIETFYIVAGTENLFGTNWDASNTTNLMTEGENGIYTWTKNGYAATAGTEVMFKVVANNNWNTCWPQSDENGDNNWYYMFPEDGTYNVVITFNEETKEINLTATKQGGEEPVEITVYTVVGPEAIFGTNWDETDTNNDMVLDAETGLYTWTADSVALTESFGFKVVGNHTWANEWPQGFDNNWIVNIAEAGDYSLVITFDPETEEINCVATKLGGEEPPVEITVYTVVGPEAIFGTNWDETDTNNDMTEGENGIYTWSKENVELAAGSFGFKVVGNHSWDNEWPMGYDNNWIAYVEEAGIYTIEITYAPEAVDSLKITCTLTKTSSIEPVHYDGDVYIMGEVNDNGGWFTNKGVLMTRDAENNVYTATITTLGENVPDGEETGYSYFSFTKQLAETEADWDAIAPYRFGAVSEGDYWVTDETLGVEIPLTNGGQAFRVPAGEWDLVLSVDNMTLIINKVEPTFMRGDVNQDQIVNISDVTSLINLLLTNGQAGPEADCNQDTIVNISDVTALINYLLTGRWGN